MPAMKKFLGAVVGELGHVEQVVGDAAHDGADLGVVVVGVVELEQVVEGVPAHIRLDVDAHDVADARHEYCAAPSMMRSTKYTAASLSTMPAVRVMPTPMAELVMVLMILGRMMSHRVVIAAQNRSMNRVFLYFAR